MTPGKNRTAHWPSNNTLRNLEDWLLSALDRSVRIDFGRLGFAVHLEECSHGKNYAGTQTETTLDLAIIQALEMWRVHVEALTER